MDGPFESVRVDILRVCAQDCRLDKSLAFVRNHLKFHVGEMRDHLLLSLESYVLGQRQGRVDVEERWPADWWQAVRERWLPTWWLKKCPVRYKVISIHKDCWKVCPHLDVTVDKARPHCQFLIGKEPDSNFTVGPK